MHRRPDLERIAVGCVERPIACHAQQMWSMFLREIYGASMLRQIGGAGIAQPEQRSHRWWIRFVVRQQRLQHVCSYRSVRIAAVAAPVDFAKQRLLQRRRFEVELIFVIRRQIFLIRAHRW